VSEMLDLQGARTLREIADELLETQRVEYRDESGLIFVPPAGFTHMRIIGQLTRCINRAPEPKGHTEAWDVATGNFQWEFGDGTKHFYIPDLAVTYPGATNQAEFRDSIALLAEVTSPKTPVTAENDKTEKPKQYAKAGVPLYLLVDQKLGTWTLHQLIDGWPKYRVHATGRYGKDGDPIVLPEPFGLSIPTDEWPLYSSDGE
jgi:Uma2 family endonuclease